MMKNLCAFIFSLSFIYAFAGDDCRPVSCTTSFKDFMGHERLYTRYWKYDDEGRLILDSVDAREAKWANPIYTEHYSYHGDSVIGRGLYTGTMAIKMNSNNLPLVYILPDSAKYRALYNQAGQLEKVIIARAGLNEKGKHDVAYSTIDSIVYFGGNIISYQYTGLQNFKVQCTYIKDTLYDRDYNASDRLLALIGRPDEVPGFFNPQVFSKELLNTEECGYIKTYSYEFDHKGRVIGMDKVYETGIAGTKPTVTHYKFKYSCK